MRKYRYRYLLASNKVKKVTCPKCGKKGHWQRYIDTETGEVLHEQYGRCDNEQKCGHWVKPPTPAKNEVRAKNKRKDKSKNKLDEKLKNMEQPKKYYFCKETYKNCADPKNYAKNVFLQNLIKGMPYPIPQDEVYKVAKTYGIGTIIRGKYEGGVAFPFADVQGNIHAVQVKTFDNQNHTQEVNFLHILLKNAYYAPPEWLQNYLKNDTYVTCLFGEHLLKKYPNNPVGIVEAPKTAIYCSLYFGLPETDTDLIWLAAYNISCFEKTRLKCLSGRKVYVFPDLSENGHTLKKWQEKASEASLYVTNAKFAVFDLLQKIAPSADKSKGFDIADYLQTQDYKSIRALKNQKSTRGNTQNNATARGKTTEAETQIAIQAITPTPEEIRASLQKLQEKQDKVMEMRQKRLSNAEISKVVGIVRNAGYYTPDAIVDEEMTPTPITHVYADYVEKCKEWGDEIVPFSEFVRCAMHAYTLTIDGNGIYVEKLPF